MSAIEPHALTIDVVNVALARQVPSHKVAALLDIMRRSTHADAVAASLFQLAQIRIFLTNRTLTEAEQGCGTRSCLFAFQFCVLC